MPVEIDHGGAEFEYVQLARILRDRIVSGEYAPGVKLPSIADIVELTGLDTKTIRRSMRLLADEDRVDIRPGRGTFVRRPPAG